MTSKKEYVSEIPHLMQEWNWERNVDFDPSQLTHGSHTKVWWRCNIGHEWQAVISSRSHGYGCPYCASQRAIQGKNDLQTVNPALAKEWNYEKNSGLSPADILPNSSKKAWWKCNKGHEWQSTVSHRSNGRGCPYCSNKKVLAGYNDLQTINPDLAKEWNYEKNGELLPSMVSIGSQKKAWWRCVNGHEWQAMIYDRKNGNGCPYCSSNKVLSGYNDLQTLNPIIANEWNHEKNKGLTPTNVMPNSNKKVWWICDKGHEWQTAISHRNNGNGCPYCSGKKVLQGYNDLETANPSLAKEWNYEKNGSLSPQHFTAFSNQKMWWKCSKGHEWQSSISHRSGGRGCPICSSERKTSFPEFALVFYLQKYGYEVIHSYREQGYELDVYIPSKRIAIEFDGAIWHNNHTKRDLDKNQKCTKDGITLYRLREGLPALNDTSLDFIVQKDQKDLPEVLEKVLSEITGARVYVDLKHDGIAIENLREFTEKEKSFLSINPEVAKEWNYERNGILRPEHFGPSSNRKVWWKCAKGHEWQAVIKSRNAGCGCPYCSGRIAIQGENDLETTNPILAKEWNYEKNNGLTPMDVMANSNKKAWWKCDKGHEWQAVIASRNRGNGCPECYRERRKSAK